MKNQKTIISGFPGIGKSTYFKNSKTAKDSDSSQFPKGDLWPDNYISHIKELIDNPEVSVILVSTHQEVRDAMDKENIKYVTMIPSIDRKEEFLENYKNRGSSENFISLLDSNWESWINEVKESGKGLIELHSNVFLSDILPYDNK